MRLKIVEGGCRVAQTMETDGTHLNFTPAFVDTLSDAELKGLLVHEVLHCALGHPWRLGARHPYKANVAMDIVVNMMVELAGFTLPRAMIRHTDPPFQSLGYAGQSFEWVYDRLPELPPSLVLIGNVIDPAQGSDRASEDRWRRDALVAIAADISQGALPAGFNRLAEMIRPPVDPKAALMRWMHQTMISDEASWERPNARYIPYGLYLPSMTSSRPAMGTLVIGVDTSGSIDNVVLGTFHGMVELLIDEARPAETHVLYADAAIARADVFLDGDLVTFKPAGGGGTDFRPVFTYAATVDPVGVIYLTDLYGTFPRMAPAYPVLWVTFNARTRIPFGDRLVLPT